MKDYYIAQLKSDEGKNSGYFFINGEFVSHGYILNSRRFHSIEEAKRVLNEIYFININDYNFYLVKSEVTKVI